MRELTCDVPQAGAVFGLGRNASYEAARTGEIETIQFGRLKRVPISWIAKKLGVPVEVAAEAVKGAETGNQNPSIESF
tara:strand:- start:310 stop:543 length:234 start_codon:yes stop_codon:yes gene_type:complete